MKIREATIAALLAKVGTEAEAAAQLLEIASDYLEARNPMPEALADHLAKTFRLVASAHRDERATELAQLLGLAVVGATRKRIDPVEVATLIANNESASETSLKKRVAKAQGVGRSTALKYVKAAKEAHKMTREILAETDGPLVRRAKATR